MADRSVTLTITFDVTGFTTEEVGALVAEVAAQAEESSDHPDATLPVVTVCTTLEKDPDGFSLCRHPDHDHSEQDEATAKLVPLVCHDCGVPVFYDSTVDRYFHANQADAPCFLSTTVF